MSVDRLAALTEGTPKDGNSPSNSAISRRRLAPRRIRCFITTAPFLGKKYSALDTESITHFSPKNKKKETLSGKLDGMRKTVADYKKNFEALINKYKTLLDNEEFLGE